MPAEFMVVVDANVFKDFYRGSVGGHETELTASAVDIFHDEKYHGLILIDEGGQVESEWRQVVDPQWFAAWLDAELHRGFLVMHSADNHPALVKDLNDLGFPKGSRDVWYVRLSKSAVGARCREISLVSEDLDFYDPSSTAKGDARVKLMKRPNAPVRKYLRRSHEIHVNCVEEFCGSR
jgi:hypothetical protein